MSPSALACRLAYEATVETIKAQEAKLDEIRTRAGVLLSVVAVATSFLGAALLDRGDVGVLFWIGVVLFALVVGAVLFIEWPRDWHFGLDTNVLVNKVESGDFDEGDQAVYLRLAKVINKDVDDNKEQLNNLYRVFAAVIFAVGLLFVAWFGALA